MVGTLGYRKLAHLLTVHVEGVDAVGAHGSRRQRCTSGLADLTRNAWSLSGSDLRPERLHAWNTDPAQGASIGRFRRDQ